MSVLGEIPAWTFLKYFMVISVGELCIYYCVRRVQNSNLDKSWEDAKRKESEK